MKILTRFLVFQIGLFLLISAAYSCAQSPFSDPKNSGGWELNQAISDEFEGTVLDESKWFAQGTNGEYKNRFKGRAPSQFIPANVGLANGHFTITSKWQPEFEYADEKFGGYKYENVTTGAVVAKKSFLYGYLETRCKAASGPISSSFWSTGKAGELDVFEHFGHNPESSDSSFKYQTSFHDWRTPETATYGKRIWTNVHQLPFKVSDDFHVYGMEWNKDFIKVYVDGILVRCATKEQVGDKWVVDNAQNIWLDSETFPWEFDPNKLTAGDFPGDGRKFVVDYVRVWQKKPGTGPAIGCSKIRNLLNNPMFEAGLESWNTTGDVTVKAERSQSYKGSNHIGISGEDSAIEQTINVKPNTTYIVSAWAKAPATDYKDVYHDAWLGVKNYDNGFQTAQFFHGYWHRKSLQFKTGPKAKTATVFFTNEWSDEAALVDNFNLIEAQDPRQ